MIIVEGKVKVQVSSDSVIRSRQKKKIGVNVRYFVLITNAHKYNKKRFIIENNRKIIT